MAFPSLQTVTTENGIANPKLVEEPRLIKMSMPERMRMGETDEILLSLEINPSQSGVPTISVSDGAIASPSEAAQLMNDVYQIVAVARLELAGMQISPMDTVSEPLMRGKPLAFHWTIKPPQAGTYRGKLWLFVNLIPKAGGAMDRRPVLAIPVNIKATSVYGIAPLNVRVAGWIVFAAGVGLGLSLLIPRIRRIKFGQIM